jgi:hypothetical protein
VTDARLHASQAVLYTYIPLAPPPRRRRRSNYSRATLSDSGWVECRIKSATFPVGRWLAGCRAAHRAPRRLAHAADDHLRLAALPSVVRCLRAARRSVDAAQHAGPAKRNSAPELHGADATARREGWTARMVGCLNFEADPCKAHPPLKLTLLPPSKQAARYRRDKNALTASCRA